MDISRGFASEYETARRTDGRTDGWSFFSPRALLLYLSPLRKGRETKERKNNSLPPPPPWPTIKTLSRPTLSRAGMVNPRSLHLFFVSSFALHPRICIYIRAVPFSGRGKIYVSFPGVASNVSAPSLLLSTPGKGNIRFAEKKAGDRGGGGREKCSLRPAKTKRRGRKKKKEGVGRSVDAFTEKSKGSSLSTEK